MLDDRHYINSELEGREGEEQDANERVIESWIIWPTSRPVWGSTSP